MDLKVNNYADYMINYWAHMLDEAMDDKTGFIHSNFMFFWGCGPKTRIQKGCLSQWWPCSFEIDGIRYNCAEQYMMAEKARVFGDREMLDAILKTSNPKDIKAYGRAVRGFDPLKWNDVKYDAVVRGNLAKFSQNPELKKFLLSTGDAELVEASPKDRIWGIGLSEDDPRALDKSKWRGQNLLGKALMLVRDKLRNGGAKIFESYAITLNNNIWSRAGHAIELTRLKAELNKNGIAKPLFLNKDFERTEWYSNTKDIQDVDCFAVATVDQSVNFCDITSADDLQTLGLLPIFADKIALIFQQREPYFALNSNDRYYKKCHLKECKIAISCYVNAFNELAQKFNISINQFKYFPSMLMCNFNNVFQNIKLKQQQSLIKNNAYSEFEILFDNNINKEEKNGNGKPELLDGYKCLLLTLNKYFQTHTGIADLRSLKGAGTDFLQLVFFNMIASAGYDGFFCREIDRSSLIPKYDTIALFNANAIQSIDNFTFNFETKKAQFAKMRYKYDLKYKQAIDKQREEQARIDAEAEAEAKAKAIADQAEQAEAARRAEIQMAKMAKMAKEREIAKAEAAKVAAAEAVKHKMQIKQNYLKWCKDAKPNVWSVRFNSVNKDGIRYGVLVIGGNEKQAQKVAEDFIKKQFPVGNYGNVLKTFSDYDYPSDFRSFVIDKTNYYIRNEKSYEDLFDRSLIPTDITPPVAYKGTYTLKNYSNFSDAIWFKYVSKFNQDKGKIIWSLASKDPLEAK